jgi:anaerobic nitric oxide reductase transcription regulator
MHDLLTAGLPGLSAIVGDLTRRIPAKVRYQRLLEAVGTTFRCDAVALLQLDGDQLVPRAVRGLQPETLGRRFAVAEQPRFGVILESFGPVRFPADSPLQDPYDGLVLNEVGKLLVHDCMGIALRLDGRVWGALTLDALSADRFDDVDTVLLETFAAVATATIRAAELIRALQSEVQRRELVQDTWISPPGGDHIIGEDPGFLRTLREARVVAASDIGVLIEGETGVGKELVARLIHRESRRNRKPMVELNCAALPENLAESELFGHVRGAFSGAHQNRAGRFELAHQGTLFLDEVGELPLSVQGTLLRALQSGQIQRVGSDRTHRVDVRIIAATNRDLRAEADAGRFRADLYHRISGFPILVPPLRERGDDTSLLTGYFLERAQRKLGVRSARIEPESSRWLRSYAWPGNVRELEHALDRAVLLAISEGQRPDGVIRIFPRHLGAQEANVGAAEPPPQASGGMPLNEAVDAFKRQLLRQRIALHDGNLSAAARSLGVDRGNLHRQLKRLGMR